MQPPPKTLGAKEIRIAVEGASQGREISARHSLQKTRDRGPRTKLAQPRLRPVRGAVGARPAARGCELGMFRVRAGGVPSLPRLSGRIRHKLQA